MLVLKRAGLVAVESPSIAGAANADSDSTVVFAPGEIVTVFGQNMGQAGSPVTAQIDPATGKLATTLAGAQVLFDNVPAPLVCVSATQSSAVVPFEVAGNGAPM